MLQACSQLHFFFLPPRILFCRFAKSPATERTVGSCKILHQWPEPKRGLSRGMRCLGFPGHGRFARARSCLVGWGAGWWSRPPRLIAPSAS